MNTRFDGSTTPSTPDGHGPVIFMDPRNPYAAHLLQDYAARLDSVGMFKLAEQARAHAADIVAWQDKHGIETLKDPEPLKKAEPRSSR